MLNSRTLVGRFPPFLFAGKMRAHARGAFLGVWVRSLSIHTRHTTRVPLKHTAKGPEGMMRMNIYARISASRVFLHYLESYSTIH